MSEPRSGLPGTEAGADSPTPAPENPSAPALPSEPAAPRADEVGPAGAPSPQAPPAFGTPPGYGAPTYGTPTYGSPTYGSPTYGAPGYGPPTYGAPAYGAPTGNPSGPAMSGSEERNWAVAAHLSGFVAAYVALGFIGPLVVMLASGSRSAFVRRHAVEALNFNLSVLLYAVVSAVLVFVLIGIPMLVALALLYLVTTIQAAMAASRGQEFRYPLTIRFVS